MMTLEAGIAEYEKKKRENVPAEILDIMTQSTVDLKQSGIENSSVKRGMKAPEFSLPNHKGETRSLAEMLEDAVLVLSFYRGGWCPYCNLELNALQQSIPEIEAKGARLVAISPELPDKSLTTRERHALSFDVLYDKGNGVAEQYGLVFTLPQVLRPIFKKSNLNIPEYNGDSTFSLPVPATYIIGQDGVVRHHFVDADYTRRMEPASIVEKL